MPQVENHWSRWRGPEQSHGRGWAPLSGTCGPVATVEREERWDGQQGYPPLGSPSTGKLGGGKGFPPRRLALRRLLLEH